MTATSVMRDYLISVKETGKVLNSFIYVNLNLSSANNKITDQGIVYLGETELPSLEFLHLSTNPFG